MQRLAPEWGGVFLSWAKSYVRRNLWRLRGTWDFDDAVQECAVKFYVCKERYIETASEPVTEMGHFFALWRTSVVNLFNQESLRLRDYHPVAPPLDDEGMEMSLEDFLGAFQQGQYRQCTMPDAPLALKLSELPEEALTLLFMLADEEGREVLREPRQRKTGRHGADIMETENEHLCRLLGLDPRQVDLVGMLRAHLSP